jgi:hypothetical protein
MNRRGLGLVDAELHDGNVGGRIDVLQYRPRAMIESPRMIKFHVKGRKKLLNPARECGIARSGIFDLIESRRKPAEIMDRRGAVAIVTPVSGTYQCAEMHRIAFGRGMV